MADLEMEDLELWYEGRREKFFFFFVREPEFRWFSGLFAPKGPSVHARFEKYLSLLIDKYEVTVSPVAKWGEGSRTEHGVHWRLLTWRSPAMGLGLEWRQRAAEIVDHMGERKKLDGPHSHPLPLLLQSKPRVLMSENH